MRDQIYYWKCDSPSSTDAKKRSYFKEKYDQAGLAEAVLAACRRLFGDAVLGADPLRVDGNHTAFRIRLPDRACFFRADDGSGDDDYMRAESALMARAAAQGLPVPKVLHTDVSRAFSPFRFQIMELCPDPPLDRHHKAGTLDQPGIARQLGRCLRQLHAISLEGFGFIDTDRLARDGTLRGLDTSYADYFFKRFEG